MPDSTKISAKRNIIEFNIDSIQEDEHIAWIGGEFVPTTAVSGGGISTTINTKANILALPTTSGNLAYANDTERLYIADGTNWFESAVQFTANASGVNIGLEQNESRQGYGPDYITDKRLSNILIGGNAREETGGLRIDVTQDPDTLEIYLRSVWQTILYDLTVEDNDFRHTPLAQQIYVWRGDSVEVASNNRPIIQEYNASMGSSPPPRILYGGTF